MTTKPYSQFVPAAKRNKNFSEVDRGFLKRVAVNEARRCPQCHEPPCVPGCPLKIDIPTFIRSLREGDAAAALDTIRQDNPLPGICGRVCLAPCESVCVLTEEGAPIKIRDLERYAADHGRNPFFRKYQKQTGPQVAVIGSGPAGLAAAAFLARDNYQVTIFESLPSPGGALRYGIPDFRLPKNILDHELEDLRALGVATRTHYHFGQTITQEELFQQGFAAILLALGSGGPEFLPIPGTHLGRVYYAQEFLLPINFTKPYSSPFVRKKIPLALGSKVAVLGDSQVALDCARVCRRLGKEVAILFEKTEEEISAHVLEREQAGEEGVRYEGLTRPKAILANGDQCVSGIQCERMDFADPHSTGEWQLMAVPDSDFVFEADTVIMAAAPKLNPASRLIPDLKTNADGSLWMDEATGMTSVPRVFAAGDCVTGAGQVVDAIASGKRAARSMNRYLQES